MKYDKSTDNSGSSIFAWWAPLNNMISNSQELFYSLRFIKSNETNLYSLSYLSGLLKISGKRLIDGHVLIKGKDLIEGSRRLDLAHKIKSNLIPESDLFYLKRYIATHYPDFIGQYSFQPILV